MPFWPIESVSDGPDVTLEQWAAFEVPLNGELESWTRHLAGFSCRDDQGQVSSAVKQFDPKTRTCLTESGRVYRLVGRPGLNMDGDYVWNKWKRIASITQQRDVSGEVFAAIQSESNPNQDGD